MPAARAHRARSPGRCIMDKVTRLNTKLFADGADLEHILRLAADERIRGFTTNPTLMWKAGLTDYTVFCKRLLEEITDRPISFEVFTYGWEEQVSSCSVASTSSMTGSVTGASGSSTGSVMGASGSSSEPRSGSAVSLVEGAVGESPQADTAISATASVIVRRNRRCISMLSTLSRGVGRASLPQSDQGPTAGR